MKFLIIDGNSILNRAFYGIRLLTNKKGVPTNAITGFMNTLFMLEKDIQPDRTAVAFDLKAPTFRHKLYDGYKANRHGMPDELAQQLPYVKDIIRLMGIKIIEQEGYEADDIIGTISAACAREGWECFISTGDRDSFQLVNDKVTVRLAKTKDDVYYTPAVIEETYGVAPRQMIEVKALMGDSSDNIPGVKGIGEKTALNLIQNFKTVDGVYENIDSTEITNAVRNKLAADKEMCYLSRQLAEICLEAPIDQNLENYKKEGGDDTKLAELLTSLEMFSALKKLQLKPAEVTDEPEPQPVEDIPAIDSAELIFDFDGTIYKGKAGEVAAISKEDAAAFLLSDTPKHTFNLKQLLTDSGASAANNVSFDTTLAAYLLSPDSTDYSLEKLCAEYGVGSGGSPAEVSITISALNFKLYGKLYAQDMLKLLTDIEIPLATVLVSMEREGVELDKDGVESFGREIFSRAEDIQRQIYEYAGEEFNIGSPKQLGNVLFDKLMLPPPGKKNKTGYSTNAEVLEQLSDKHPIIPLITEYRALTKLHSTYVTGLLKVVAEDGRIHSTFKQTETRTGRISSVDPNIQNIPVRTPLGREMRRFFRAKEGCVLVDADYSQIELRVLAHISDDSIMQQAFKDEVDIHTVTASQVFDQPVQWVTSELRSKAKAVNFGIVYGIGAFSLSKDIGVSVKEAGDYIKQYLSKYSGVSEYMNKTVDEATKSGYVSTLFGRRRTIRELASSNKIMQALGKRIAMNTPIQGTAADIIKIAMIKVYDRLKASGLDARLILQVHDELIVEVKEEQADAVSVLLKEEMENAVKLSVPMTVDVNVGKTWYDTH
ncbi:MAG: DNA polymerase I [Eubacterium sp.]|nr:DNA polymerase I [Eubacterium sp.]